MAPIVPPAPDFGEAVSSQGPDEAVLRFLARRRSTPKKTMTGPGPDRDAVETMLRLATRAPDHGKLAPWRFIVFEGAALARLGDLAAESLRAAEPGAGDTALDLERANYACAPTVVAVVFSPKESAKIPEWEQVLSAGAVCQNLLIAATAMGFAAHWVTERPAYDAGALERIGVKTPERVAGFFHIGTGSEAPLERVRPDLDALITYAAAG